MGWFSLDGRGGVSSGRRGYWYYLLLWWVSWLIIKLLVFRQVSLSARQVARLAILDGSMVKGGVTQWWTSGSPKPNRVNSGGHGHTMVAHCHTMVAHCHTMVAHCHTMVAHCHTMVAHCHILLVKGAEWFYSYLSTFENFPGVESARQLVGDILPIARGRYKKPESLNTENSNSFSVL